ncbi:MAG: ABC transporter ATP-binding protein [Fibrobacterota bacterium]
MSNSIIEIKNVYKHFHRGSETVHAVEDVSLCIKRGEYVAVVGHSGSGKTTLMNMIGCLDRPTSGSININGRSVEKADEKTLTGFRRREIGFVFQQFFLIPTLTVLENVELPSLFTGTRKTGKARTLLDKVGLKNRLNHLPSELSGGEMQRVAIARSVINDPKILLADEPTGNLDSGNAEIIMELFDSLNKEGITIVMVTHNLDLVKHFKKVVHIEDGKINIAER